MTPYGLEIINGIRVTFMYDAATGKYQATLARKPPRFESTRIFDSETELRRHVTQITRTEESRGRKEPWRRR